MRLAHHARSKCVLAQNDLTRIVALLRYDKSNNSSAPRGRALIVDVLVFNLKKNDRLEPSIEVPNIGDLSNDTPLPVVLTFWRRSRETAARHRNPLFADKRICTALAICVDELHTLHLGIFHPYLAKVLSSAVEDDVYMVGRGIDKGTARILTVTRIRADLWAWYTDQQKTDPNTPVYRLADFVPSMFTANKIGTKAAESGSLLHFVVHLLREKAQAFKNSGALIAAGEPLLRYLHVTRHSPRRLSTVAHQAHPLCDAARYLTTSYISGNSGVKSCRGQSIVIDPFAST